MTTIKDTITTIMYGNGIWYSPSRCWWMCITVAKKMPKNMRNELLLAEGENHYWLQDTDGNKYDIYGEHLGYTYDLTAKKLFKMSDIISNINKENYETREAFHTVSGHEKYMKIPFIDDSSLIDMSV